MCGTEIAGGVRNVYMYDCVLREQTRLSVLKLVVHEEVLWRIYMWNGCGLM